MMPHDSFPGTSVSLFQHPANNGEGTGRQCVRQLDTIGSRTVTELPIFYREAPLLCMKTPVESPEHLHPVPVQPVRDDVFKAAVQAQQIWLDHVDTTAARDLGEENISWDAYHASQ